MNPSEFPFLPTSSEDMRKLGWNELDIVLITGDCYIDHPSFGTAIIGRLLQSLGYRVGIIAQPDWTDPASLQIMGQPRLCCGVSSGNLDSMVNIYTAARRLRKSDAYSEGGETGKRPPHAEIVYSQLARRAFPGKTVFLGGVGASLRRVAHYDYWQDKLRPSVLLDSKADILVFGMGENPVTEIVSRLETGKPLRGIRGTAAVMGKNEAENFSSSGYVELPSWEEMQNDRDALLRCTVLIEQEMNPCNARGLIQRYGERLLVVEPPAIPLSTEELDNIYDLPFTNLPHPKYKKAIPAFETIKHSIPAVRGCPGGCSFCGLVAHQGRSIRSRSQASILREAERIAQQQNFKGTISDIGGAAGNIYNSGPVDAEKCVKCRRISCLFPAPCPNYQAEGEELIRLLRKVREIPGVKHVHINSGIRLDLAVKQRKLMRELIFNHVSGHLKVAPEHLHPKVLKLMRKNPAEDFYEFLKIFAEDSEAAGKKQYLIPLFISNFPGCTEKEMKTVDDFLNRHNWSPQQVQDYIPLPMTMGAAMYYCGKTADGEIIPVNRGLAERRPQMEVLKKQRRGGQAPPAKRRSDRRSRRFSKLQKRG
ncbi:MAG: YgiQ family radical SAM protein [Victivallaceae bacterium]|nr:YgiQ family radical SAM protein [Victivallaceae bacterium]